MKALSVTILAAALSMQAAAQTPQEQFEKFRQQTMDNYQQFRKSVIENYAEYLNTVWQKYQSRPRIKRDNTPKPTSPPDVKSIPVGKPSEDKPTITPVKQEIPKPEPQSPNTPPVPAEPVTPAPAEPVRHDVPQATSTVPFDFYGITLQAPQLTCISVGGTSPESVSSVWKKYLGNGTRDKIQPLITIAMTRGLNDWYTYEMVRLCVDSQCRSYTGNERMLLKHFILANMGYNVRLALQGDQFMLLVRIQEQLYGRRFTDIDGNRYYLFTDNNGDSNDGDSFYTCTLPSDADLGKLLDLKINNGMKLNSGDIRPVKLQWNDIIVNTEVDVKEMEMLRHYPQIDIPFYAESVIDPKLRADLLKQVKPHIDGMSQREAANKLLHFVQNVFGYQTDGEQHGFEKTYFLEENFYYDKNDCEDRAIVYGYLVKNLLGLDVQLIQYPGHECTAVNFKDTSINGDGYVYGDKTYIICDPTYIGADIGQCMPQFRNQTPKLQMW